MTYRTLDPARILSTARTLEARVTARFPDTGLRNVAAEITALTRDSTAAAQALEGPIVWLRILLALLLAAGLFTFLYVGTFLSFDRLSGLALTSVERVEAVINTAILAALGLATLVGLEARIKRGRVARQIHAIRSVIHVIDMHQLTKDPLVLSQGYIRTEVSPDRPFTPAELTRYLDYCSEMLSLTGKIAALFAQSVPDDRVAEAVHDIEMLGSTLSRKVWQKIVLLEGRGPPG